MTNEPTIQELQERAEFLEGKLREQSNLIVETQRKYSNAAQRANSIKRDFADYQEDVNYALSLAYKALKHRELIIGGYKTLPFIGAMFKLFCPRVYKDAISNSKLTKMEEIALAQDERTFYHGG